MLHPIKLVMSHRLELILTICFLALSFICREKMVFLSTEKNLFYVVMLTVIFPFIGWFITASSLTSMIRFILDGRDERSAVAKSICHTLGSLPLKGMRLTLGVLIALLPFKVTFYFYYTTAPFPSITGHFATDFLLVILSLISLYSLEQQLPKEGIKAYWKKREVNKKNNMKF